MRKFRRLLFQQYRDYVVPVITGMAILLLSVNVLMPRLKDLPDKYATWKQKQEQLTKLIKKRSLLESVNSDATRAFLSDAEAALPQEKEAAGILIAMENLSAATQFTVDAVNLSPGLVSTDSANSAETAHERTGPAKSKRELTTIPIALRGRGTNAQFMEFLSQVLSIRRVFSIEHVAVNYSFESSDFLTADLTLDAYYLPPITEISAIDEDLPQITPQEQVLLQELAKMPYLSQSLVGQAVITNEPVGKHNPFGE